ncbi:DUF1599 domain-containing protein [Bergeyella zoohelcum]|uniref:Domain of Uncharacterized Function (DUF1599) n=1 Tax=Bergeyella zoohelcum TaxID=1015 RepID=A0A7Z8YNV3_9FLAO|nr:DUF1599 domain-containing protein [Bergeyella zoohelcum]VDH02602.1 Domain of Uncharacterised Function (DUF1599) [Bergeyella zoohelcum]
MTKTIEQFQTVIHNCRSLFQKKFKDYGSAFRILRASSVTDQMYIKVKRLVTIQETGISKVDDESQEETFIALVNYSIIGLIQLTKGTSENLREEENDIFTLYDDFALQAQKLMERKNHDYGEAWREMRITAITDLIYQKILRTKEIENNQGKTLVSEGIEANYFDIINYAVFAMILISED